MRIVLDTNVIVSGLLNPNRPSATILSLVLSTKLQMLYDNRMMQEYIEVLHRDKFGFDWESVETLLDYFKDTGEYILAEPTDRKFVDDNDRPFYEVMISGRADYLISGNLRHFPKDDKIISPRDFIIEYEKNE